MNWVLLISAAILLPSCSKVERIPVPEVSGSEIIAVDTDLYPIYDRAYYERTLPDDQHCRIRYTADYDYSIFSGNRYISERLSMSYIYASQYSDEFEAYGHCTKIAEVCEIRELRRGYTITISGDRLNITGVENRVELLQHINFMYRHGNCVQL